MYLPGHWKDDDDTPWIKVFADWMDIEGPPVPSTQNMKNQLKRLQQELSRSNLRNAADTKAKVKAKAKASPKKQRQIDLLARLRDSCPTLVQIAQSRQGSGGPVNIAASAATLKQAIADRRLSQKARSSRLNMKEECGVMHGLDINTVGSSATTAPESPYTIQEDDPVHGDGLYLDIMTDLPAHNRQLPLYEVGCARPPSRGMNLPAPAEADHSCAGFPDLVCPPLALHPNNYMVDDAHLLNSADVAEQSSSSSNNSCVDVMEVGGQYLLDLSDSQINALDVDSFPTLAFHLFSYGRQ